jgi:hypothetical protein
MQNRSTPSRLTDATSWTWLNSNRACNLTSTGLADGGGGRNAPNNSRAFDESFFQYDANGRSSSGPLGTDRPNAFKGYTYYRIPWKGGRTSTNIGWFQTLYSGTPMGTYIDVGHSFSQPPFSGGWPVFPEDRGKFAKISLVPNSSGVLVPTVTSICTCRTPWYIQSDASFKQEFKINKSNEAQVLTFEANALNLFNRQSATGFYSQLDSAFSQSFLLPGNTLMIGRPCLRTTPGSRVPGPGFRLSETASMANRSSSRRRAACVWRCGSRSKLSCEFWAGPGNRPLFCVCRACSTA